MKAIKKYGARAAILLLLVLLAALSLVSCTGGSDVIYSKEELFANIEARRSEKYDYAWKYLDEWDFPSFGTSKLASVENIFRERYYKELSDPITLATDTAKIFLSNLYDEIDLASPDAVTEGLSRSLVAAVGDKYSLYRSPAEYDSFNSSMSGTFIGIGVTVTEDESGAILVLEVLPDSPASEADIMPGDLIVKVGDVSTAESGYDAATDAIPSDEGASVEIEILRGSETLKKTVTMRTVVRQSVTYSLEDGIGYIRITQFLANTDDQFKVALDYMKENGAKGIVYDLRANPGGYLSSVVMMLSYIAPRGTELVSFSNDYGDPMVDGNDDALSLPTVILVNENTASAGELFTGGVRDIGKISGFEVKIVGKTTFGKGIMQSTYMLSDGSSVTLTVAYYNFPLGDNCNGAGISPDVDVEFTSGNGDSQLNQAYEEINKLVNNN